MPRLTVVVPVYNVERYLGECLDSLLAQDFGDFEAVLVNDGSTDGSRAICERYCARDARLRLVDKPNGGLSSARNAGMAAARGDYVSFLDSDDRYRPEACGRIVGALDDSGADVLVFGGAAWPEEESYPWLEEALSPRDATYEGFSPRLMFREAVKPFSWRLALAVPFARRPDVAFDETVRYGEDQLFAFAALPRASRCRLIPDHLYDYRIVRGDSMLNRMLADKPSMLACHVDLERRILDDWEALGILEDNLGPQLDWVCEFVLFDALRLDEAACARVWGLARERLLGRWSRARLAQAAPTPGVRALVLAAYDGARPTRVRRTALMCACYRDWHGVSGVVRRLVHGPRATHS